MPIPKQPVKVDFGPDNNAALEKYVWNQCTSLKQGHKDLHENQFTKWRSLYYGKPAQEHKDHPWPNASNLVVQVIGQYVDMLKAAVLAGIYEVSPLWVLGLVGDWAPNENSDEQRSVLEDFMGLMGLDPKELDLYRVEHNSFEDAIKYGTVVVKHPWETDVEIEVIGDAPADSSSSFVDTSEEAQKKGKTYAERDFIKYDGPRPEKLPFNQWMVTPDANTIDSAEFKIHIRPLTKYHLEERKFKGIYDKIAVEKLIETGPDRSGADAAIEEESSDHGTAKTASGFENGEWDIYECHFPYWHNKKKYNIIYSYHYKSKQCLRAVFNFYPDNMSIFKCARLGYGGDRFHGYGFAEMLEYYQEEISTTHNQDIDNNTLANTSILRIDPSDSRIDSAFSVFPMAILPFRNGEVEVFNLGRANADSIGRQNLTLQLASSRAGVDPGTSGMGGGVVNPKKGIYSAMGTMSVMQAGNRRTNINVTDIRYFHLQLGTDLLQMYAHFGVGDRIKRFGEAGKYLTKALENVKNKRMHIPVRAATASVNRELEKQNDMLLVGLMRQHYMGISQILQTLPQAPPHMQGYMTDVVLGSDFLMRHILRNFGHDDISRLLPEPELVKELREKRAAQSKGQSSGATGSGSETENTERQSVLPTPLASQGSGTVPLSGTGNGASASILPGSSGAGTPPTGRTQ